MNRPLAALALMSLSACAHSANDIQAAYVSPVEYASFSCRQLYDESVRVATRTNELAGAQNKQAQDDAVATTFAVVLFLPAAFLINGNDQTATELSQLKGRLAALKEANSQKDCGIVFEAPAAGKA
ncbi:hypothetical protein ACW9UR_20610 [Halovulum sp. GXIMD14794]